MAVRGKAGFEVRFRFVLYGFFFLRVLFKRFMGI